MSEKAQGQDGILGTQGTTNQVAPPARASTMWNSDWDNNRNSEQVKLRLRPEDAIALRIQARQNARSISAHVARLVATAGDPIASRRQEDQIADASQLAAAIQHIPNEIRSLRLNLNSLGGLIKSLFIRPESMLHAECHSGECARTLAAIVRSAESTEPICSRIELEFSDMRSQLEAALLRLARD